VLAWREMQDHPFQVIYMLGRRCQIDSPVCSFDDDTGLVLLIITSSNVGISYSL